MKTKAKRIYIVVMIILLAVTLVSCGKSTAERWQEQYDLGQKYLTELDYEQAIISFTNAIEIDPNQANAYAGRAEAYSMQNDYAAAISDYSSALELDSNNIDLYFARSDAYIAFGDSDMALADYNSILSIEQDNPRAKHAITKIHENNIKTLIEDGELDKAIQYIEDNKLTGSEIPNFATSLKKAKEIAPQMLSEDDLYIDMQLLSRNEGVFGGLASLEGDSYPINYEYPDTHFLMQVFENDIGKFIYYGEQDNGVPNGNGILMAYNYLAKGYWINGKPNGNFKSLYMFKHSDGNSYCAQRGQVIDGMWNGQIELTLTSSGLTY